MAKDLITNALRIEPFQEDLVAASNGVIQEVTASEEDIIQESEDFRAARENLRKAAEIGLEMLQDAAQTAKSSQDPEFYEAFASILKQVIEVNGKSVDIHVIRSKRINKNNDGKTINNNLFVTTTELQKALRDMQGKHGNE